MYARCLTIASLGCLLGCSPAGNSPPNANISASNTTTTAGNPAVQAPANTPNTPAPQPAPANTTTAAPSTPAPQPAPKNGDVSLKILSHDEITKLIASHRGKVVVVDCWSTQCGPCIKEFPNLVAMHKKYGDKVACVSLSFDYEGFGKPEDRIPDVKAFLKKQGATFDNVLSSDDSDTLSRKFDFVSIPVVLVYGQDGKLAQRFDNEDVLKVEDAFTYKDVEALVSELVKN